MTLDKVEVIRERLLTKVEVIRITNSPVKLHLNSSYKVNLHIIMNLCEIYGHHLALLLRCMALASILNVGWTITCIVYPS